MPLTIAVLAARGSPAVQQAAKVVMALLPALTHHGLPPFNMRTTNVDRETENRWKLGAKLGEMRHILFVAAALEISAAEGVGLG